jgi:hypothetical protein
MTRTPSKSDGQHGTVQDAFRDALTAGVSAEEIVAAICRRSLIRLPSQAYTLPRPFQPIPR